MTPPKGTTWDPPPHTLAKHLILSTYLKRWFPILGSTSERLVYLDGFAGSGEYDSGDPGSPVLALEVAAEHVIKLPECVFLFTEKKPDRAQALRENIQRMELPGNIRWQVYENSCEEVLGTILDDLDERRLLHAPTFAFIDPFGIKGIPFTLISRLLERPKVEVLFTFMAKFVNRFVDSYPHRVNELIGQPDAADLIRQAPDGFACACDLYSEALHRTKAEYVWHFTMRGAKNERIYKLFFATKHRRGLEEMKTAMWKVDETGGFNFSDANQTFAQLSLLTASPERQVAFDLMEHFRGRTVLTNDVYRFTIEHTDYLEKHARAALKMMESGSIEPGMKVTPHPQKVNGSKRQPKSFPLGVIVTFGPEQAPLYGTLK